MPTPTPTAPLRRPLAGEFHLADWFTLANAACGTGALFSAISYVSSGAVHHVVRSAALIIAALVFDVVDGRVARWRHSPSLLGRGRELDSLADVISFGVAPAMLAYVCGMQGTGDRIVLACGVARLARFDATADALRAGADRVPYFEGTPIPTSVVLVVLVATAASRGAVGAELWLGEVSLGGVVLHPLVLLFALSGTLRISRLRIPKL